jgi:hypothetical protein
MTDGGIRDRMKAMKAWIGERRGEFAEAKRPTTPANFLAPKRQLG